MIFSRKKHEKKLKILSLKPSQKMEETVPLKLLFVLSRYLNPLLRYKDLKLIVDNAGIMNYGSRPTDLYFFLEKRTTFFQESCLSLVCNLG